jgi:hypothetical protein
MKEIWTKVLTAILAILMVVGSGFYLLGSPMPLQ